MIFGWTGSYLVQSESYDNTDIIKKVCSNIVIILIVIELSHAHVIWGKTESWQRKGDGTCSLR